MRDFCPPGGFLGAKLQEILAPSSAFLSARDHSFRGWVLSGGGLSLSGGAFTEITFT